MNLYQNWRMVRRIGSGSYGTVYEVENTDQLRKGERAALKKLVIPQDESEVTVMRSNNLDDESITRTFRELRDEILNEYRVMRDLSGNSNIVNCLDVGGVQHEDGFGWDVFIVMELLTPLRSLPNDTFSEQEIVRLGKDICRALSLCEKHRVIHRDIKPDNIFISKDGNYKLGDFGIARVISESTENVSSIAGTFSYMAPEVLQKKYNKTADIYSLGLVLYWLLNERRTPFLPLEGSFTGKDRTEAQNRRFNGEPIPAPAHGSNELKQIVLKACAFDSKDRYQSSEDMLHDLEALETSTTMGADAQVSDQRGGNRPAREDGQDDDNRVKKPIPVHAEETLLIGKAPIIEKPDLKRFHESETDETPDLDVNETDRRRNGTVSGQETEEGRSKLSKTVLITVPPPKPKPKYVWFAILAVSVLLAVGLFVLRDRLPWKTLTTPEIDIAPVPNPTETPILATPMQTETPTLAPIPEDMPTPTEPVATETPASASPIPTEMPTPATPLPTETLAPVTPMPMEMPSITSSFTSANVGGYITFGCYEQDNNLANGAEPIEWLVLAREDDRILVISRYALDCQQYNSSFASVTWETCSLRGWLNGSFLSTAFTEEEQTAIPRVMVSADRNPRYDTNQGNSTTDRVFLLSITEANKYFSSDEARRCVPTAFAIAQGVTVYPIYAGERNDSGWWWLRSSGRLTYSAANVHLIGRVLENGDFVTCDGFGVRPAMWIDLNAAHELSPTSTADVETVESNLFSNSQVGDYITFGHYEQDNNMANGAEPIEWLVLGREDDRILVISRYGLDCQKYNSSANSVTWEMCTLQSWLNSSFLNTAFTAEEQAVIPRVTVNAEQNRSYSTNPGNSTQDQVFLLSIMEVQKYFTTDMARRCEATEYAKARGCYVNTNYNTCWWWLRSPGRQSDYAAAVKTDGSVISEGSFVANDGAAVRPTIWINTGT